MQIYTMQIFSMYVLHSARDQGCYFCPLWRESYPYLAAILFMFTFFPRDFEGLEVVVEVSIRMDVGDRPESAPRCRVQVEHPAEPGPGKQPTRDECHVTYRDIYTCMYMSVGAYKRKVFSTNVLRT